MNILEVKNIYIKYNDNYVIKDLSFNVEDGDYLCIVGENGSGKSTLLKCVLGLIKPTSGEIILNERAGYLPQITDIQNNFPATIEEIVLSGIKHYLSRLQKIMLKLDISFQKCVFGMFVLEILILFLCRIMNLDLFFVVDFLSLT